MDPGDSFFELTDEELDELLDDMQAADEEAAAVLREALRDVFDEPPPREAVTAAVAALREGIAEHRWPYRYWTKACGWTGVPPGDDADRWVEAAAATISPPQDPDTPIEDQAVIGALEHADWFALVVGLVRRGVGARFDGDRALADFQQLPELQDDAEAPDDDDELVDLDDIGAALDAATTLLAPLWQALGALDDREDLTTLGRWGLPRALERAWLPPD